MNKLINIFPKEGFKVYLHSIKWFSISRLSISILSFLTSLLVVRGLGPERFGLLSFVISFTGLFSIIANLGVDTLVYKKLVEDESSRERILVNGVALKLIMGLVAAILVVITLYFITTTRLEKTLILLLTISFFTQPFLLFAFDLLKDRKTKTVTLIQIAASFLSNILKIIAIVYFNTLSLFVIATAIEYAFAGLCFYTFSKKYHGKLNLTLKLAELLSLLLSAVPLTLFSAFSELYSRIDQILLKHYVSAADLGYYAAGVRISELWYLVPNVLMNALFPALARIVNTDQKEYKKRTEYFGWSLLAISLCISLVIFIFSKEIITILYGEAFIKSSQVLSIYIFSLPGFFISLLIYQDLLLRNKLWSTILVPFVSALLNIALNIILIPTQGIHGAAIATMVSYNVAPLTYLVFIRIKNGRL